MGAGRGMEHQEIDGPGLVDLLRRRAGLVALTLVVCLGIAGVTVLALTPLFSASALVLVDPSRTLLLDPETVGGRPAADGVRVDSEVEILRSDAVLLDVVMRSIWLRTRNLSGVPGGASGCLRCWGKEMPTRRTAMWRCAKRSTG